MTFKVSDPTQGYRDELSRLQNSVAAAATLATKAIAQKALTAGRASIAAAGFGAKWQNALRARVFPESGSSLSPAAVISSKIPYADVFEDGAVINGQPFLWLPLSNVPIEGGRRLSAGKFAQSVGVPLRTIKRPGKRPLLAAVIRTTDTRSKGVSLSLLRRGANITVGKNGEIRRELGTVRLIPFYVGVPAVNIAKKFDVEGAVRRAVSDFDAEFNANFKAT